jgi:RNA 2',3'-cyclic 3'-phosphodiesterase
MQRRIFIGISLPEKIKKRLYQKIEKWRDLPIKWSREENFHITLSFLGYLYDDVIFDVCRKVRSVSDNFDSFDINLEQIELGPNLENPNMIWLTGVANDNLKQLQENLEKELGIFQSEKKAFRPHVTLGRIRKTKWEVIAEKTLISEKFSVSIPVKSVEVLESRYEEGKRKYIVLENCPLA